MVSFNDRTTDVLQNSVQLLQDSPSDYTHLLDAIGNARFVCIGEASHGTHEFYKTRADITRRLIREKAFNAVVVEADWPDAWRVNRFVRGFSDDSVAEESLRGFKRFPQWMWRNTDVLDFVGWLREFNESQRATRPKCGFYGMDLYSLYASIEAVLNYLQKTDPDAARRARYRYSCFDHFRENPQAYGYAASFDLTESCEKGAIEQLLELQHHAGEYVKRDGRSDPDEYFFAEQNARLIINAEEYYRSMFKGRVSSWNLRDTHMVETIENLTHYLDQHVGYTRMVIWAHNSHLGDARATEMGAAGEINVGQLVRQKWDDPARSDHPTFLLGFSTHTGSVTAADDWDEPAQRKRVRPSLPESYERFFHDLSLPRFLINLRDATDDTRSVLEPSRLQRAIGVIYRPETERMSHYFSARLPDQFDALIHIDETRAVEPLERTPTWERLEVPETYPTGV